MVFRPTHLFAALSATILLGLPSAHAQVAVSRSADQMVCSDASQGADDNIVWGTGIGGVDVCSDVAQADDNIIWGTVVADVDADGQAADENIVWGTRPGSDDNIVWGTLVSGDDNIIWGTSIGDDENIVWGTAVTAR